MLVPTVIVFAVASVVFSGEISTAIATSAAVGIVALSLVVVTGYTGQLSLAQFSLAGVGAWLCSVLIAHHGWPFEVAAIAGVAGTIPIGILVGLPSLRTRGVNLAIATLGLAVVIEALILGNGSRNGGITGLQLGTPSIFGVSFDPLRHPHNYALLCC
ncbi:MAG: hypothetical protein QOD10_987, partial [Mycobacterium sp.]|nr:hypothetical protein [Mycobacterium sp.]